MIRKMLWTTVLSGALGVSPVFAKEYLVKWRQTKFAATHSLMKMQGIQAVENFEVIPWSKVVVAEDKANDVLKMLKTDEQIEMVQPNYVLKMYESPDLIQLRKQLAQNPEMMKQLQSYSDKVSKEAPVADPAYSGPTREGTGADPQFAQHWRPSCQS